jgi:hypothetical protein
MEVFMETNKILQKKIRRKNFVYWLGTGLAGFLLLRPFTLKLFKNQSHKTETSNKGKEKIKLKINPLAVSRNKSGGIHG